MPLGLYLNSQAQTFRLVHFHPIVAIQAGSLGNSFSRGLTYLNLELVGYSNMNHFMGRFSCLCPFHEGILCQFKGCVEEWGNMGYSGGVSRICTITDIVYIMLKVCRVMQFSFLS